MRTTVSSLALALGLAPLCLAADESTTTVNYFYPSISEDSDEIDFSIPRYASTAASIVSVNALETTMAIACESDAPTSSCSIKNPQTMINGISTWSWNGAYTNLESEFPVTVSLDYACSFESYSIDASCTYSASFEAEVSGSKTSESTSTEIAWPTESVSSAGMLVTGGVEKLREPEATETPGVAAGVMGPYRALVTAAPVVAAGVVAMF